MKLESKSLILILRSPEEVRADLDALDPAMRKEVSPEWLQRVAESNAADPWLHGFSLVEKLTGANVGSAGFKAPPGADGTVEVAYGIHAEYRGKGYATEAAAALADFAFANANVRVVRAHTLPEPNASTRVLAKCGFGHIGEVIDSEDGLVWLWEKGR